MVGEPSTFAGAGDAAASSGTVVSLTAGPKKTVVKVGRGRAIVAKSTDVEAAVVVGRLQQSVVPAGGNPAEPTAAQLTAAQKKTFAQLEKSLPVETDKTPPLAGIKGPHALSSVRRAKFVLNATEQAAFSCSLDGSPFRLCIDIRQSYDHLPPGKHMFLLKATDPAGNTSAPAQFGWTIDSSKIAFASTRDGNPEIYVSDPDGEKAVRLTNNLVSDENPEWSPDRSRLTFDSLRNRNLDVYVMNADGSAQNALTSSGANDRNPSWSPDGRKIAFESDRDGDREIFVMNADGSAQTQMTFNSGEDFDARWSPDSRKLTFTSTRDAGNYEIYSMNADGSAQTRLTNNSAVEFGPTWSPDGRRIAFHSLRGGQYQNIYMMNADGSNVTRLTNTQQNDYNPAWAPDSVHLVYQSNRDIGFESQLYVLDVDTREEFRLTPLGRANYVPNWG
jgi:Tol biopolymer transport system component